MSALYLPENCPRCNQRILVCDADYPPGLEPQEVGGRARAVHSHPTLCLVAILRNMLDGGVPVTGSIETRDA